MKILIATGLFPPDIGGPATYSKLLSDELPKGGVSVFVESFGSVRHMAKGIRHVAYAAKLLWSARDADVVFAQDTVSVGLPALLVSYLLGKIFIVRVPGDYAWEQAVQRFGVRDSIDDFQNKRYGLRIELLRSIQKLVVRGADRAVAPSVYFGGLVSRWSRNPDRIASIYNGIDIAQIRTAAAGVVVEPKTIVSAGRLVPWKGFGTLIRAMKKLDGWKLVIAGDGPEMPALRKIIAAEGLSDRVSLAGRLSKDELIRLIASADIFALNTHFESFSFQVVEAMAAGTPVIATKVGNLAEIITDGSEGLLVVPDSEDDFVRAIRRVSSDPALRHRFAEAGKKKAEMFSIERTVLATREVLDSLDKAPTPGLKRRQLVGKLVRYLFSGGVAAVTDLVLLYVFTDVAHIWYVASSVLAFLVAFGVSFFLQKFFTFQDNGTQGMRGQAAIYLAVTGTNLAINTGLIYLLVQYTGLHYLPAQILTSIIVAVESYVLYGMFIFKDKGGKAAQ
ncbi:MAG: putative glycosyltransferase [Candidatus Parcubacteria bacterium]|nr:putative glycosyltransferase [Candidatus Parcubacteria bacterium]